MKIAEDMSATARSEREKRSQHRLAMEHLVFSLSSNLFASVMADLEGTIGEVLKSISAQTGADYCYLLVLDETQESVLFQFEFLEEGTNPAMQSMPESGEKRFLWFTNRLDGGPRKKNEKPGESSLVDVGKEAIWTTVGIKTMLLIPLAGQNRPAGALAFGSRRAQWKCSSEDVRRLRFVGDFLVHGLTRKRNEDALLHILDKYQNVFAQFPHGILLLNLEGEIIDCNDEIVPLLGLSAKSDLAGKNIRDFLEKNDGEQVEDVFKNALEQHFIKNLACSIVKKDGEEFHVEMSLSLVRDVSGRPSQMIVEINDVSHRQETEHVLQETEKQLAQQLDELRSHAHDIETLTEMVNMLQICSNQDEAYAVVEKVGHQLFPSLSGGLLILDVAQAKMDVKARWSDPSLKEGSLNREDCWALRRGRQYYFSSSHAGPVCSHVGDRLPSSYLCTPIIAQGMAVGLLYLESRSEILPLADSQQKLAAAVAEQIGLALSNLRLRDNLREQAIRDPLTGLYNRYYMEESLARELSRAKRSGKPIGVIMLDLDHFKELNTRFGHPNVDVMLQDFGKMLQSSIRAGDIACRYGGDEFLLILPEASLKTTCDRALQLCQQVKKLVVRSEDQIYDQMTISVGVAVWPQNGQSTSDILHAVDTALLQAKKNHDCVITA